MTHTAVVSLPLEIPSLHLPGPLHLEYQVSFTYSPPSNLIGSPTITITSFHPLTSSLLTLLLTLQSQLPLQCPLFLSQLPPEPLP